MGAYPFIIDILLVGVAVLVIDRPWARQELAENKRKFLLEPQERQIAASSMKDEAMACVTVASILLVALGAALGAAAVGNGLEEIARHHFRYAILLCVSSLGLGIWILGSLPGYVNFYNVARNRGLALFAVAHVAITILAAIRVVSGLWSVLEKSI